MAAGLGYIEFTTGEVLTAAQANGYLASQVVMVFANASARTSAIASPQEGMISFLKDTNSTEYYSGSAWVAIGGSSAPTFIGARVYNSGSSTIPTNTNTVINWGSESFDTDGFHSTSSNTSRMTIPSGKAGYYRVIFGSSNSHTASAQAFNYQLRKNGSTNLFNYYYPNGTEAGSYPSAAVNEITVNLAEADYLEVLVWKNGSGDATISGGSNSNQFEIHFLGA